MIDTAITADAEVRRLRQLGEATHDWCEACPPDGLPRRPAGGGRSLRALGDALRRAVSPRSPQGAIALTAERSRGADEWGGTPGGRSVASATAVGGYRPRI